MTGPDTRRHPRHRLSPLRRRPAWAAPTSPARCSCRACVGCVRARPVDAVEGDAAAPACRDGRACVDHGRHRRRHERERAALRIHVVRRQPADHRVGVRRGGGSADGLARPAVPGRRALLLATAVAPRLRAGQAAGDDGRDVPVARPAVDRAVRRRAAGPDAVLGQAPAVSSSLLPGRSCSRSSSLPSVSSSRRSPRAAASASRP